VKFLEKMVEIFPAIRKDLVNQVQKQASFCRLLCLQRCPPCSLLWDHFLGSVWSSIWSNHDAVHTPGGRRLSRLA
jgi:hypothetical protein